MLKRAARRGVYLTTLVLFLFFSEVNTALATSDQQLQWPLYENAVCGAPVDDSAAPPDAGSSDYVGSVFMYLVTKGLSKEQAAGVIGNLQWESGDKQLDPTKTQNGGHSNSVPLDNTTGYGIAQWTITSRKQGLINYAHSINKSVASIEAQEGYLWKELKDDPGYGLKDLQAASTYENAADVFMRKYERPKVNNLSDRAPLAKDVLGRFKDTDIASATTSSDNFEGCTCSTDAPAAATGKTVLLDPGHAGGTPSVETVSGIETIENSGADGERQSMWDTAQIIKTKLEHDGYKVVLTKNSVDDTAGFKTKIDRANASGAAIAVSMHYTGGVNFGTPNDHFGVTPQQVGRFRENKDDGTRVTFSDTSLASKSEQYAQDIAAERNKTGDKVNVAPLDNSFPKDRPDVRAWGDIPIVELFGKIPWVYNEVGSVGFDKQKYAEGISNGIEKALGKPSGAASPDGASATGGVDTSCAATGEGNGDAVATAFNYAYSDGRKTLTMKDTYASAIRAAKARHEYIGGTKYPGIDCGGFVTRTMRDSGADKNYNTLTNNGYGGPTGDQEAYMDAHPDKYQKIGPVVNTGKLQPGDIAVTDEHTYMYVGPESSHPQFKGNAASASWDDYAPTANNTYFADTHGQPFNWYRLIK
jgi:N-acetylmuramoyl-L-alanine amidase